MSRWIDIGPIWNTETTYRVRELLKEKRIPFRMPYDEMFFQSMYHLPHRDWTGGFKVKKQDADCVLSLLEKEGLLCGGAINRIQQNEQCKTNEGEKGYDRRKKDAGRAAVRFAD